MNIIDPVREYLWLAKWLGIAAIAGVLFVRGCNYGEDRQARKDAAVLAQRDKDLSDAGAALNAAAHALKGSAAAIREINAEAERRIAQSDAEAAAFATAAKVAEAARRQAEARASRFAEQVEDAKRRKPACADLMNTDLEAVCGIKLR